MLLWFLSMRVLLNQDDGIRGFCRKNVVSFVTFACSGSSSFILPLLKWIGWQVFLHIVL